MSIEVSASLESQQIIGNPIYPVNAPQGLKEAHSLLFLMPGAGSVGNIGSRPEMKSHWVYYKNNAHRDPSVFDFLEVSSETAYVGTSYGPYRQGFFSTFDV